MHRRLVACWLVVAASSLLGQSSIRGWGLEGYFDTESRDGPATFVSAAIANTVVVLADGRLYINGRNYAGPGPDPVCEVPNTAPGGLSYVDAQVGAGFGIARLSDGSLMLWGGDGYNPPLAMPSLPVGLSYTEYAVGGKHALFLRSDGSVVGIGDDTFGQASVPSLPAGASVSRVFAGPLSSAVILSDGSLWCWGDNLHGACNVPPLPAGLSYVDVSLQWSHSLAIRSDGSMVGFGDSTFGQATVPVLPPGITWLKCAVGSGFSLGLRSDGELEAWGYNAQSQVNVPPLPPMPIVRICAGSFHGAVLLADGRVRTWGHDGQFRGDLHELPGAFQGQPTARFVDFAVGGLQCLALLSDQTAVGFAYRYGTSTVFPPLPPNTQYTKVFASYYRSAALRSDGELIMFGRPGPWQVVPPLPAGVSYIDAALTTSNTLALRSDGEVVAFGWDQWGESTIPPLPPGTTYKAIDAYYSHSVVLRSDDVVHSLGFFGPTWPAPAPTPPVGVRFVDVATARFYDAVLRTDGEVVTWDGYTPNGADLVPPLPWGVYYVEMEGGEGPMFFRRSDGQVVYSVDQFFGAYEHNVPSLEPGTSYVQLSGYYEPHAGRVGPTTTYTGIGHGCSGSLPTSRLVPRETPRIGRTFEMNCFDLPYDVGVLAMSFVAPSTPIALDGLGMPGCAWHVGIDATAALFGQQGTANFTLHIPDQPQLVGLRFQHQVLVLDPAAGNGFGAVVSDAMEGVVGYP